MAQFDISPLFRGGVKDLTFEHDDERASRLRREDADARSERHKSVVLFYVLLLGSAVIFYFSVHTAFRDITASADEKKWAKGILTTMVTGSLGYLVGRKTK